MCDVMKDILLFRMVVCVRFSVMMCIVCCVWRIALYARNVKLAIIWLIAVFVPLVFASLNIAALALPSGNVLLVLMALC